jgi:hypothetical protein
MPLYRGPYSNPYSPTLDSAHEAVHEGQVFDVSLRATLASTEAMEIALTVPAGVVPHVIYDIASEKIATLTIVEDVTSLAAGTAATIYNANRNSATTSGITSKTGIPATPLTYTGGTTIHTRQITTGTILAQSSFTAERMIKADASTVFRLVAGANSCDASINLRFYVKPTR